MSGLALWDELPTKGELKARIDAFLRAFQKGDLTTAFRQCPPMVFVKDEGLKVQEDLEGAELIEHLSHTVFQFLEGQSVAEDALEDAVAEDPSTWVGVITPPGDVDFEDLSLDFPWRDEDDDEDYDEDDEVPDETRAKEEGEVLANVHLCGECTDITAKYYLMEYEGKWVLCFGNFDVM